jgi:hypothetical protein
MMRHQPRFEAKWYYNLSLERLVPEDHLLRPRWMTIAAPSLRTSSRTRLELGSPWSPKKATRKPGGVSTVRGTDIAPPAPDCVPEVESDPPPQLAAVTRLSKSRTAPAAFPRWLLARGRCKAACYFSGEYTVG